MNIYLSIPGVICAAGATQEEIWNSVINGNQSGIKKVPVRSGEEFFAGKIADARLPKSSAKYDMRIMRIEEVALNQIADKINLVKEKYGADRVAVCVGSCDNGTEFSVAGHEKYFSNGKFPDDYSLEIQGADYVATFVTEKFGLAGSSCTYSTACSSSAGAIIKAAELIMSGQADAVVAGGVDIASDTVLIGFNSLEAVSSEVTNPFSKNRHGITIGEAAAFFVVTRERLDSDVKLLGFGESSDAYHMTSPDPSGAGAERAMRKALASANLEPRQIDYINLHGTGTKFNDSMEAKAVDAIFGDYKVPVSTTKCETGHTLGAAGALELAICHFAICENQGKSKDDIVLPAQVWDGERDEELPELNFVSKGVDKANAFENCMNVAANEDESTCGVRICMSNSFAFGGSNASMIIGV